MMARLGYVIYWATTALALGTIGLGGFVIQDTKQHEQLKIFLFFVAAAFAIWIVGRAFKYIFAGE